MTIIVVNTASDTVANDGKTSLREAVATAGTLSGHVEIRFDQATFYNTATYAVTTISLKSTLIITKGDISIDGSLYYGGNSFGLKISGAGLSTNAITVDSAAHVTLRDLKVQGPASTTIKAQYGADGHNGAHGSNGVPDYIVGATHGEAGSGLSGGHATDGSNAPNDAEAGHVAVGAIINRGTLTLERVDIASFKTEGGAGGLGGLGGGGGRGGNGFNGTGDSSGVPVGTPGNGGNGGNSGDGARGGEGGDAVGGIYNVGTLILRDASFAGLAATGGHGGAGGAGWSGGHGGNSGESQVWAGSLELAHAGDGGAGGNGGNGGRGGVAASALLNAGTVKWDGVQSSVIAPTLHGGLGGQRGEGGREGFGGHAFQALDGDPRNGKDSLIAGINGLNGANGGTGDFVGAATTTGVTFSLDAAREVISETATLIQRYAYISVHVLGANTGAHSVKWSFKGGAGITGADFVGGTLPAGGKLDFASGETGKYIALGIAPDGKAEGIETFTITLSDPVGGVLGWSKSVTVAIIDGNDLDGNAPTALKLSASTAAEGSAKGRLVGALSTTDADKGDQFHYALLNSAGGRFALSGNNIVVAKGYAIDYEQAQSHNILVRSTDLFGQSIDKTLTIKVTDVLAETVAGDAGVNKLVGGTGIDKFDGKAGNDTLTGGGGKDWFTFSTALSASSNVDHITDFKTGQDLLRLDDAVFKHIALGKLTAAAFYNHAVAHDSSDRILYDTATGKLYYDGDGKDGAPAVLFAVLDGHPALAATDILIV